MNTERTHIGWGFWLWWVLASSVGIVVLTVVAALTFGADVAIETFAVIGAGLVILILFGYGAITGGVMVWLLRQPSREA